MQIAERIGDVESQLYAMSLAGEEMGPGGLPTDLQHKIEQVKQEGGTQCSCGGMQPSP